MDEGIATLPRSLINAARGLMAEMAPAELVRVLKPSRWKVARYERRRVGDPLMICSTKNRTTRRGYTTGTSRQCGAGPGRKMIIRLPQSGTKNGCRKNLSERPLCGKCGAFGGVERQGRPWR
jgi:hypothetical protein